MSKQATWALAAIAAVMLAFIVFYEQHTISSGELESRRGQVLNRFLRDRVTEVTLTRGGDLVASMRRDTSEEETLDTMNVGTWALTAPVTGEVDTNALDALFLACDSVSARRTIEGVTDADRATFGLDAPRLILTLQVADERQVVRVGGDEAGTEGVFVEVEGTNAVHIVGHDFFEALDRTTDDFRSKRIVPDFIPREVRRFALTQASPTGPVETRIEAHGGRMRATAPFEGWVRASALDAMFDALLDARATSFLPDAQASLVASPELTVVVTRQQEDRPEITNTVRIGAACAEATQVAVRVDEGSVACVERASLSALFDAQAQLRETRLLMSSEDQAERIEVREGTNIVDVQLNGEDWVLRHGTTQSNSDQTSVHDFVRQLRAQNADAYLPASNENLTAHGLTTPRGNLLLRRADAAYVETIDIGALDTTGVWVRRGDEAVIAHFAAPAPALLTPDATRFRSRELVRRDVADATALTITRGGVEERLGFANDTWRIESPAQLAADRVATRDLIAQLAALHAVRWVPADETPALTPERFRVQLTFSPPHAEGEDEHGHDHEHEGEEVERDDSPAAQITSVDLRIGAATEGGAFARLGEGAEGSTFVISTELVDALTRPLADRELLAINSSDATQLEVHDIDGTTFTLSRGDNGWMAGDRAPATDATAAFMERLRSLRARAVVDYAPADAFTEATWSVAVTTPSGVTRLELGAVDGDEVTVRSSGAPVEMRLSAETARALREYRP